MSLMELIVSMSIFVIVLIVYFSALITMTHTTVRAQDTVNAADNLRAAFNALDHQVRYASAINRPGTGGTGNWYVEFEATDLPSGEPDLCYQWRYDVTEDTLAYRTWSEDGISTVSDWRGVSWNVLPSGAGDPFAFTAADGTILRQTLTVNLKVEALTNGEVAAQSATFVARNSSYSSQSNVDADLDGVSDSPVCTTGMDRP
jgi:type II secretory pathway component PulJ